MAEESKEQNTPMTLEGFWKLLDSKLVSLGVPGALLAVALDFARKSEWKNVAFCAVGAAGIWLGIKVVNRLSPRLDKLLDWIFGNVEKFALDFWGKLTSDFEAKYYQRLRFDCREYEIRGINRGALQLENVFVPLKMEAKAAEGISQNMINKSGFNPGTQQEIGSLLVQMKKDVYYKRLAILGAPGSGKSTLLRHITLMYATRRQRRLHRQAPKLIPVFLQLRYIYQEIIKNPEIRLVEIIEISVKNLQKIEPLEPRTGWFAKQLRHNKCLLMLDGLDEIPDDNQRQAISTWVDKQIEAYPDSCFILTSRPEGYKKARLQKNVWELEVQPFNREQRDKLIQDWYFYRTTREYNNKVDLGVRDKAKTQAQNLIGQIEASPSLRLMARNPLLLNMIAITHEKNGTLSTKRIDLYKEICRVLLEGRQRAKGLSTNTDLSAKQKQVVLRSLALELTRQNTQAFTLDSSSSRDKIFPAQSLIKEKLERFPQQKITPEDFIKKDDLGVRELLSEREQEGIYEFAHKTFQEYLAAVEITVSQQESLLFEAFTDEKKLAWCRETIRFYAAQTDASNLIQTALNYEKVSVLTLAYQCSKEAQEITPDVQQQLKDKLELGLESNNVDEFTLAAQVKLADRLSQLNHDLLASESNLERESIAVDSSYINWAEYQLFLNENNASPTTLENKKQANQPVTGISFWDANSFCAWLSLQSRKELGEPGICYRQPTQKDKQNADGKIQLLRFQVPPRYAQLAYYLAAGMWKEADEETDKVMVEVAGREKQGYLGLEDIRQFPCEHLRTIDQLWVNYSNGHFGFSVQKEIYLSVGGILEGSQSSSPYIKKILSPFKWIYTRLGGRVIDDSDQLYEAYSRLGDEVGWKVNGKWIGYQEVTYNTSSQRGHLPSKRRPTTGWTQLMTEHGKDRTLGMYSGSLLSRRDL